MPNLQDKDSNVGNCLILPATMWDVRRLRPSRVCLLAHTAIKLQLPDTFSFPPPLHPRLASVEGFAVCCFSEGAPNLRLMTGASRPGSMHPGRLPQPQGIFRTKIFPQRGPGYRLLCPAERIQQSPGETAATGSGSGVIRAVAFVVYTKPKESHKDASEAGAWQGPTGAVMNENVRDPVTTRQALHPGIMPPCLQKRPQINLLLHRFLTTFYPKTLGQSLRVKSLVEARY